MAQKQWASIADLFAFEGIVMPTMDAAAVLEMDALLVRASRRVARMLRLARISYDSTTGLATPASVAKALNDMTCAQAAYMQANGDDGTGTAMQWDSISLIGVQFSKAARANADAAAKGSSLDPRFAPEAMEIAIAENLFSTVVNAW